MPNNVSRRHWIDLSPRTVNAFLVVVIVLIIGVVLALLQATWIAETKRASVEVDNLSAMVEQDIRRTIELYDLSLQGARDAVLNPTIMGASRELRDAVLFDRASTATFLGELVVLDQVGDVVASSRAQASRADNHSDRDYFRIHALSPNFGLYVSRPLLSRHDGQMEVALSRRITRPDGGFGGVVVGTLQIAYLQNLFRHMQLGPRGAVALYRNDGTVMMREPFDPQLVGTRHISTLMFDRASRSPEGEYQGVSPIDGELRLYHFRRLGALPLIVDVGLSLQDIHAGWWRRLFLIGGIVGLCCGSIIFVTLQLGRELRRRIKAETALRALVDIDGLTGLANRRCFDRVFDEQWRRSLQTGGALSLLMIDADHFKAYNDRLGHAAGDEALRQIGRCLAVLVHRSGDLAARYGGEEFAVVLSGVDEADAFRRAEAIRQSIEDLGIAHPDSLQGVFTVSIGCATADFTAMGTSEDLATAADKALYGSKRAGRNAVRAHRHRPVLLPMPLAS